MRLNNLEIVRSILRIMNLSESYIEFVRDRLGHDQRYALNSTKIHQTTKTRFESDFYEMLEKTIQWYQANFDI